MEGANVCSRSAKASVLSMGVTRSDDDDDEKDRVAYEYEDIRIGIAVGVAQAALPNSKARCVVLNAAAIDDNTVDIVLLLYQMVLARLLISMLQLVRVNMT
jgi:hypothetical protein